MAAVETESGINSKINTQIEGYEDYYENDLWSFDQAKAKSTYSEHGHQKAKSMTTSGKWKDETHT
jgi:hypothetical protein